LNNITVSFDSVNLNASGYATTYALAPSSYSNISVAAFGYMT